MALDPNQFLLYDTAVSAWMNTVFGNTLDTIPTNFTVGTPDRAFAEYVTGTTKTPRDGRPPLPRVALTLEDPIRDPERFNPNVLRKLGYTSTTQQKIRRAYYPLPFNLPYTLNFWTEKYREMNLFEQRLIKAFRHNYLQILVDIDSISPIPVYGQKYIELYADGGIVNSGSLEPTKGERDYRRTFSCFLKAWLWDLDVVDAYSLREVEVQTYRDKDLTLLFETKSTPQRENLFTGVNGVQTAFGPVTPKRLPIIPGTLLVDAVVGGDVVRGRDDGQSPIGAIADPVTSGVTGTVNYSTGEISLTYVTAPDAASDISAAFYTKL